MNALAHIEQQQQQHHHHGNDGVVGAGGQHASALQFIGQPDMRTLMTNGLIGGTLLHNQQQQQQRQQQRPTTTTTVSMKMESGSGGGLGQLPQLDGGGQFCGSIVRRLNDDTFQRKSTTSRRCSLNHRLSQLKVAQLDGGKNKEAAAPGMTDESSEEEEREDEEDPTLAAIKYGLAEDQPEGEAEEEEEPLNSGDDQSDDEDLDTLFDADNVVVCQFEKVHRARNKWKFTLKDGIMQIRGKDYCFQKCTGEAEW